MKKCPYCAEEIQDEAIVCKYCGKNIKKRKPLLLTSFLISILVTALYSIPSFFIVPSELLAMTDIKLAARISYYFGEFIVSFIPIYLIITFIVWLIRKLLE